MKLIEQVIKVCKNKNKYIGICGQPLPSDFPEFFTFLVEQGIDSISLNPGAVVKIKIAITAKEKILKIDADIQA